MSTYIRPVTISFGSARSGQEGNVGVQVLDTLGNVLISRTTAGVTETKDSAGNKTTGEYTTRIVGFDTSWAGWIKWDITGMAGVALSDPFLPESLDQNSIPGNTRTARYDALGNLVQG